MEIKFGNKEKIEMKDFFSAFYPVLTSFASKYIPNKNVCEDIVQDVFMNFLDNKPMFLNINMLKGYFYVSVRNSCLDYLKHFKVEEKYRSNFKNQEETDSFWDEILRLESHSVIYSEINKLPEMGKKVLLLALRDNSNEEIAKKLEIAINTVKTHKARAYKVLRNNLKDLVLFFFSTKVDYILSRE